MISSHRRVATIAITACCAVPAAGALAAQASAATLAANKACYVNPDPEQGAPMVISGTGFVPGATVTLSGVSDPAPPSAVADANGNVSIPAHAPELHLTNFAPGSGIRTVTATADNPDLTQTTVSVPVRAADLSVNAHPTNVRNVRKDKVTYSFSGFVPGKHIYGYWINKKVVGKIKFGKATGACGTLQQKALLFPGGRPKKDSYNVTFENTSKYDKTAFPRVTANLMILRF
jgi:hypothetical protein